LHGAGERGDDLELVKMHGPPKLIAGGQAYPMVVIAPQCPRNLSWYPDAVAGLTREVASKYKIDPQRIYLTGLSMGGYGTWATAAKYPELYAALAPICGGGDPDQADKLKHLPIWAFHGAKDSVVPLSRSQQMVDAVRAAGGNPQLTIYPDAEHDSWTETYNNPALLEWMLQQRRQ
jgi:predicted peptidase